MSKRMINPMEKKKKAAATLNPSTSREWRNDRVTLQTLTHKSLQNDMASTWHFIN